MKMLYWQELYDERMEICRKCEYYNQTFDQCKKCGCLLKFKARVPRMKCPIGKWDK